jgi:hypothetical protein
VPVARTTTSGDDTTNGRIASCATWNSASPASRLRRRDNGVKVTFRRLAVFSQTVLWSARRIWLI